MPVPEGYPYQHECFLTLNNGREVFVRPVLPSDRQLFVDFFEKISERTRYLRFLQRLPSLPEPMLRRFSHLDYISEFALVAMVEEEGKDAVVGIGRYSLDPEEGAADLGITVRDDWQHLGLGKILLEKVLRAGRLNGICRFESMMDPHNDIVRKILRHMDCRVNYLFRDGAVVVRIGFDR